MAHPALHRDDAHNRAEIRLATYSGTIQSELQRHSVVPLLLARDPVLINSLETASYLETTARLISYVDEIGAASLVLLDREGRIVAATDRERLGQRRTLGPVLRSGQSPLDTGSVTSSPRAPETTGRFDYSPFSRAFMTPRTKSRRVWG